jgi:hypothetical protein
MSEIINTSGLGDAMLKTKAKQIFSIDRLMLKGLNDLQPQNAKSTRHFALFYHVIVCWRIAAKNVLVIDFSSTIYLINLSELESCLID